jgi:hypothetical protein
MGTSLKHGARGLEILAVQVNVVHFIEGGTMPGSPDRPNQPG